jgi:hypothetical protein
MIKSLNIFFLIFMLLSIGMLIYAHELSHQAVFKHWGTESTIKMIGMTPSTIPLGDTSGCGTLCEQSHDMVDAIGYHFIPGITALMFGIYWLGIKIERVFG